MNNIEAENAIEEIKEIVEKCVKCGMCKSFCPVFKEIREEQISPRGKAILLEKNIYNKIMFDCTFCKACEKTCPLGLKLCTAFRKARTVLNAGKKETKSNKEMIENIRKYNNPFGKAKGKKMKLYCC